MKAADLGDYGFNLGYNVFSKETFEIPVDHDHLFTVRFLNSTHVWDGGESPYIVDTIEQKKCGDSFEKITGQELSDTFALENYNCAVD